MAIATGGHSSQRLIIYRWHLLCPGTTHTLARAADKTYAMRQANQSVPVTSGPLLSVVRPDLKQEPIPLAIPLIIVAVISA